MANLYSWKTNKIYTAHRFDLLFCVIYFPIIPLQPEPIIYVIDYPNNAGLKNIKFTDAGSDQCLLYM